MLAAEQTQAWTHNPGGRRPASRPRCGPRGQHPSDTGPASDIFLDIGCRVAGKLHFRDQASDGERQALVEVAREGRAATTTIATTTTATIATLPGASGIGDRQYRGQQVVPDDGAAATCE